MSWSVYILLCDQKTLYVGMTNNFERRLSEHLKKESVYTKKFSEINCVYVEKLASRRDAEKRETQIKKWSTAKKWALINGDKALLIKLSKSH